MKTILVLQSRIDGYDPAYLDKLLYNDRRADVTAPRDGFLRIAEVYYPGWKVTIDGKSVPVYRADGAWMAVFIPAGSHTVAMSAHSLYFEKAVWVSFPVILLLILYWSVQRHVRRRITPLHPSSQA